MPGSLPGFYRGRVIDIDDPEGLYRLRVQVPQLLGDVPTDWAWPSLPVAVGVTVPAVDDPVWVTFEAGDIERPVWVGIWRTYQPGGAQPDINFGGVVSEVTYGQTPSNGTAETLARSDHTHGSPSLTGATPTAETFSATGNVGVATTPSRADHRHAMPADPVIAHLAAGDPHSQYATDTDLANHVAASDPHPAYATDVNVRAANRAIGQILTRMEFDRRYVRRMFARSNYR